MKKYSININGRVIAIVILFAISANALAAGYSFIIDPSGAGLGITVEFLKQSAPFNNYFVPGLILFTVIGVFGCVVATLAIIRARHYPLFILADGCIVVGWIAIQLMMVTSVHALHVIIAVLGIALIALGLRLAAHRDGGALR